VGAAHRKSVIPSVGLTSVCNIGIIAVGAIAGVVVARLLGPHDRGVYAIATVAPTFIGIVGTLGVEEAIVYLAARTDSRRASDRLLWGSLVLALMFGSAASAVSVAFQLIVFWSPELHVSLPLFITAACMPLLFTLTQVAHAHLRAQARYTRWNFLRLLIPLLYLAGLAAVVMAGRLDVSRAILCLFLANAAVVAASLLSVCWARRPTSSRTDMRRIVSHGWKNHLITVQTYANQQLDQVFLAAMVPPAQLGQYAIAVTYASAGLALGLAPSLQMYSHFSRQAHPDRAAYRRLVGRTVLLLTGVCIVSASLAPFFIRMVFGERYEAAVEPALILILSSPMLSLSAMFSAIWKSAGQPLVAARAQGIGLALTVVTLPPAIHYLGINGAAIVSIVTYAVVAAWLWRSHPFDALVAARQAPGPSSSTSDPIDYSGASLPPLPSSAAVVSE
jgi:O-antigen/teichoic acid export membrane protein